jgi:acyl-CoA synthetase (AMP-forming)/AMP-acid ligase II
VVPVTDVPGNYVRRGLELFAAYGDTVAMVAADGRRFTFADLRAGIRDTAAALWGHGIRPGMTIGQLVTNTPESFYVQLGAHLLGCRTVFMVTSTPWVFLRDVLGFVEADAFVYEVDHIGELGRRLAEQAAPLPTFCIGAGGLGPDLRDAPAVTGLPFEPDAITTQPQSLFQTSGTTGTPKLLLHGPRFFDAVPHVADFYRPADQPRIRHLSVSGTFRSGGQSAALMTWFSGGCFVMLSTMDIGVILDAIERESITSTHVSPPLLYQMLDDPRLADADLSSLRSLTICCSAASPARLAEAAKWFGPALNIVYGMSEHPMISALPDAGADPTRLASCGFPWRDTRVEIRDADGVPLPTGQAGEIWVAGEMVTEGYWKRPDLNAENLVDGWLRTGDVGRFDAGGALYILDRVTDMVVTQIAGTMVYCRPLEDVLTTHPDVRQAAVVGVPDELFGEAPHAYVIRAPGATVTAEELRQLVVDNLSAEWSPREVDFIDAFPLTAAGKVDKRALRGRYLTRTGQ